MCRSKAEGGRRCKGKGQGSSAVMMPAGVSASSGLCDRTRRSRTAVLRDAQKQLGDLLDAVIDAAPVDSATILVLAADADAAGQIADAITSSLRANGCPRSNWQSHLLCGALAGVARAMEAGEDLAKTVVTQSVTAALTSSGIPGPAAGLAARAAVDTLMKLTPIRHWEDVRRAVQLLAVSLCPNVADHPAVEQHCLRPLASELLSDAIQQELTALSSNGSVGSRLTL